MELYSALKVLCRPGPGDRPVVRIFQIRPESVLPLHFNSMLSTNSNFMKKITSKYDLSKFEELISMNLRNNKCQKLL